MQQVEDKTPVRISDVQSMTEEFLRRLRKKPVSHDGDAGGGAERPHCRISCIITAGRQQVEDKTPVHIADVQSMAEELLRRLRKKPVSHDGDAGDGESTVGQGVTPLQPEPEAP